MATLMDVHLYLQVVLHRARCLLPCRVLGWGHLTAASHNLFPTLNRARPCLYHNGVTT